MSYDGRASWIFQCPVMSVLPILYFIPRKTCLIRPHYIFQECWFVLCLVNDNVAPCVMSRHPPPPMLDMVLLGINVSISFGLFQTGLFKRPQFLRISMRYCSNVWGLKIIRFIFCPTLAGLQDRGRLVTQPISIKCFTMRKMLGGKKILPIVLSATFTLK